MIPIAKPLLAEEEARAAREVILSGWVTQGPKVIEFEENFAIYTGARHACAVSSCTTALHIALHALGIGQGDEVLTVSHSFIATANAILYTGAMPVFVDVDIDTFNMAPDKIEAAITPKTKAILCVHQMGMPCDMEAILNIARKHDLKVIEDAACAIGSEILFGGKWEKVGKAHGDIACFSFHPRKILTTGDGGMLTTNDEELDTRFRLLRQHGMSIPDTVRHDSKTIVFEEYPIVGFNYRMTDIQAAIGVEQLKKLTGFVQERRKLVQSYNNHLEESDIILPKEPQWAKSNWQSFCVRILNRDRQAAIMQHLRDNAISTRRGIMNSHQEKAYIENINCRLPEDRLPISELARDTGIILPLYPGMTENEIQTVAEGLKRALSH